MIWKKWFTWRIFNHNARIYFINKFAIEQSFNWFWLKYVSLNIHNTPDHLIQTAAEVLEVGWGTDFNWKKNNNEIGVPLEG